MKNYIWRHTSLQVTNLPVKVQKFINVMNLDVSKLHFILLKADPNGEYREKFYTGGGLQGLYIKHANIVYFFEHILVGVAIHELMHYYLNQIDCDTKTISENFIKQYGHYALTNYAGCSVLEKEWDEVVCEIVATYGRRGQFNKIKELLNL